MDPLIQMHEKQARFGFWISYSDMDDVTEGLWDAFIEFVIEKKLKLKQPELLMDATGKYLNTNLYGCFIGAKTEEFRSREYLELFHYFDTLGGFFKHRWDEQKLYAFYVALYLNPSDVDFFDYVSINHQEWASAASRMKVQEVTESTLIKIFGVS